MLTLLTGSYCDVCAEEFGSQLPPHCIPCGHVLCANCCNAIVEKTSERQQPACPFCREHFSTDDVRLIRTDFSSSAWSTSRRLPAPLETSNYNKNHKNFNDAAAAHWAKREERLPLPEGGCSRVREEARRLEDKVAKVAAKKCSVEEVSTLHRELEDWLNSAVKDPDQTPSLSLSAALLRAILMNHVVHSEATKHAKTLEATLRGRIDDMEISNSKLEAELRRQRSQFSQKVQECQTLRTELNRLKLLATTVGPSTPPNDQRSMSPPPTTSATPSPPSPFNSASSTTSATSSPSRYHTRTTSLHVSSRPSTPSSHAHPVRSHTPSLRSHTPAPMRVSTPAPPLPLRSHTPAPPPDIPPKPRRLSQPPLPTPPPPKVVRSLSDEKASIHHERWIPPRSPSYTTSSPAEYGRPPSRLSKLIPTRSASVVSRIRPSVRSPSPN
ncbi:hypothetical protein E1B28_006015 [Marasmius oreades]|uniref:RING-type domain-containing protein n=1 Tax=Marasmius oreades TaxID=181124 RepID=A0A9P7S5V2_9AGAR|nr:uncharacterized protein E1B28_006015 [Marasmius oreades]KAG7095241.1 hypothetical protein E1B28_006015 [Marasmius oreades]